MNRMLNKRLNEERLDKYQEGQRHTCSFCGQSCLSDRSSFNMLSKRLDKDGHQIPEAAICDSCLDRGFVANVLFGINKMREEELILKEREMEARMIGLPGTLKMKRIAVEMAMQIAKRSYARIKHNRKEPPLRFYVNGSDPMTFVRLLTEACRINGNRVLTSTVDDFENGEGELLYKSLNQPLIMEHGAIFILDGITVSSKQYSMICVGNCSGSVDLDGPDQLELS